MSKNKNNQESRGREISSGITKNSILKKINPYFITLTLISIPFNTVSASTLDDLRELAGKQRLDQKYSTEDIQKITSEYTKIEDNNSAYALYDPKELVKINKGIEIKKEKVNKQVESTKKNLETNFSNNISTNAVIDSLSSYNTAQYEQKSMQDNREDLKIKYKKNTYKELYFDMVATLKEVKGYKDIGVTGEELKSPLPMSFDITKPYGYLTTKDKRTTFHKGIDIRAPRTIDQKVDSLWRGRVTDIYHTKNEGYVVVVTHHEHLQTVYKQLTKVTVQKNASVNQYSKLGTLSKNKILHFEVILDNKAINPIYFFGTSGAKSLASYIVESTDPRVKEMKLIPTRVRDYTKERKKEIDKLNKQHINDIYKREINSSDDPNAIEAKLQEGYTAPKPSTKIDELPNGDPTKEVIPVDGEN